MCGIIAYLGDREAYPIIIKGLERLEYRGYDSAGVATIKNNILSLNKAVGKVENLKSQVLEGSMGVGHTRWATHGVPNHANAHPHNNDEKSIVLVHNGIIENYAKLKLMLINEGYQFYSDTDTEVLTKLIDSHYKKNNQTDMLKALKDALHEVVGAYGIVLLNKDERKLYAARKGSPLVLGIGEGEFFVASDTAAFLEYTRRALYLEDDDVLMVDENSYNLSNLHEECKYSHRDVNYIDWDLSQIEKNGYEHFMLKEIHEQADTLNNCLAGRTNFEHMLNKFRRKVPEPLVKNLNRIIIAACGTSWHAALVIKYLVEKYCRLPVEVEFASEFRYKNPIINNKDLVLVISQSGETADSLAALKTAKEKGALTYGIVNVVGSSIAREVDAGTYIRVGSEIGVASTKAFTGQVLASLFLMTYLGHTRGTLNKEKVEEIMNDIENLPEKIKSCYLEEENIKNIAKDIFDRENCFYLARGVNVPTALEGSLKLKEISYIHSEAFPAGEMKHGPIALIEKDFPIIVVTTKTDQTTYEKVLSNIQEVKARRAKVIALADQDDREIDQHVEHVIRVPHVPDYLQTIVNAIPLQLLAYYVAKERGCEIDQPRNLAKSVTVE
jgi:glutamine---fructose-6-phosphate transaminase (isomerizing)